VFLLSTVVSAHDRCDDIMPSNNPSKASQAELDEVLQGIQKYSTFIEQCLANGIQKKWCEQLTHPNVNELRKFEITYGKDVPHTLIHPDESTWVHAFKAAKLVQRLLSENIQVVEIYNWWRPSQYNKNVGGSPTRHPYGVSVDIRMSSKQQMEKAHTLLCKWRKKGELRALGYYGNTGLHLGIDDEAANTWGKSCN